VRPCRPPVMPPSLAPPPPLALVTAGGRNGVARLDPTRVLQTIMVCRPSGEGVTGATKRALRLTTHGSCIARAPRAQVPWLLAVLRNVSKSPAPQTSLRQLAGCHAMRGEEAIEILTEKICRDAPRWSTTRRLVSACWPSWLSRGGRRSRLLEVEDLPPPIGVGGGDPSVTSKAGLPGCGLPLAEPACCTAAMGAANCVSPRLRPSPWRPAAALPRPDVRGWVRGGDITGSVNVLSGCGSRRTASR
jgi:hypothetical protein